MLETFSADATKFKSPVLGILSENEHISVWNSVSLSAF